MIIEIKIYNSLAFFKYRTSGLNSMDVEIIASLTYVEAIDAIPNADNNNSKGY